MKFKLQSSTNYLSTVGWAALIIVVILVALWQSGIFHIGSSAQRALPGSCRVARAQGASGGTVSMLGTCNLPPEFVAQFNGQSSISIGTIDLPVGSSPSSLFAWIYTPALAPNYYAIFDYGQPSTSNQVGLFINAGRYDTLLFSNGANVFGTENVPVGTWSFVGYTYDGGTTLIMYVDGASASYAIPQQYVVLNPKYPTNIGAYAPYYFQGLVSGVQLYNTSISASQAQNLYMEGIGGAPIPSPNLVGWWPLNGDVKDYSGNNNSGMPTNVAMNSSWSGVYTAPHS